MITPRTTPPQPIFICGMFRSGSTLTEQLIASHPRAMAGGEIDFLPLAVASRLAPFPESMASLSPLLLETLAAEYLDMLKDAFPDAAYATDKSYFPMPRSFIRREMRSIIVCRSISCIWTRQ
jgi:hypothetical protein